MLVLYLTLHLETPNVISFMLRVLSRREQSLPFSLPAKLLPSAQFMDSTANQLN